MKTPKRMLTCFIALLGSVALAQEDRVLDYPENYRDDFTLYYSGDRYFAEEQTIRIYANDIARDGAQADGAMPEGSILIAELYAALKDSEGEVIESAIGRRVPGPLKAVAMMERRTGWDAQYPDALKVGDWEFEVFSPEGENLGKDTTGCRECHAPLGDSEFMFSIEHLIAAQ